jgi:hypothetical protein
MQNSSVSLEEAIKQFEVWRSKKQSKFEATPAYLKELLQRLLPYHPSSKIAKALKISPKVLSLLHITGPKNTLTHKHKAKISVNAKESNINFAKLTGASSANLLIGSTFNLPQYEIIKPNGYKLIIHMDKDIATIIQSFLCSN